MMKLIFTAWICLVALVSETLTASVMINPFNTLSIIDNSQTTCTLFELKDIKGARDQVIDTYCRCLDGSYGFTCQDRYPNPCIGSKQFEISPDTIPDNYFIHCDNNVPFLFKCPAFLLWDHGLLTCSTKVRMGQVSGSSAEWLDLFAAYVAKKAGGMQPRMTEKQAAAAQIIETAKLNNFSSYTREEQKSMVNNMDEHVNGLQEDDNNGLVNTNEFKLPNANGPIPFTYSELQPPTLPGANGPDSVDSSRNHGGQSKQDNGLNFQSNLKNKFILPNANGPDSFGSMSIPPFATRDNSNPSAFNELQKTFTDSFQLPSSSQQSQPQIPSVISVHINKIISNILPINSQTNECKSVSKSIPLVYEVDMPEPLMSSDSSSAFIMIMDKLRVHSAIGVQILLKFPSD